MTIFHSYTYPLIVYLIHNHVCCFNQILFHWKTFEIFWMVKMNSLQLVLRKNLFQTYLSLIQCLSYMHLQSQSCLESLQMQNQLSYWHSRSFERNQCSWQWNMYQWCFDLFWVRDKVTFQPVGIFNWFIYV